MNPTNGVIPCLLRHFQRRHLLICLMLFGHFAWTPTPIHASPQDADSAVQNETVGDGKVASEAELDELGCYTDYFEAHTAALAGGKHVLVYRYDPEAPTAAQIEFVTNSLVDQDVRQEIERQFVIVRLAVGAPIEIRSTVRRTGSVRRGFRVSSTSWTETVRRDLFDSETDQPGIMLVRVTGSDFRSGSENIAFFPFQAAPLSPKVFQADRAFEPWKSETFRAIVSTAVAPAKEYRAALARGLNLQNLDLFTVSREEVDSLRGVSFDYDFAGQHVAAEQVNVRLNIGGNSELTSLDEPVDARIDVYSLKNSAYPVSYVYRKVQPKDEWQELQVDGLQPETAYRFRILFYRCKPSRSLIGQASLPFYGATGGATRLANARAAIAVRALGEVHDWNCGRTRGKDYRVGRWCEMFYNWNIFKLINTPFRYGYDSRTFSRHDALISGAKLREIARDGNIMGDHVRIANHGFMVLSYDRYLGEVWTIEGNYGNSVVLTRRRVQDHWSVGTLTESMLREDASDSGTGEVVTTDAAERSDG
jgi:hypothetical protein